jgi:hypothetical protein
MLVRSTGLGRTELEGDVKTLDVKADYIIIGMKTNEPVKWHVRVAARLFTRKKNFIRPDDY